MTGEVDDPQHDEPPSRRRIREGDVGSPVAGTGARAEEGTQDSRSGSISLARRGARTVPGWLFFLQDPDWKAAGAAYLAR